MSDEAEIKREVRGQLAIVTLNRPQAMNALTLEMCIAIDRWLVEWTADPAVQAVLIKGAGERAFCAGGDIRQMREVLTNQGPAAAIAFYGHEYPMNARLHHFPKPYVALLDGVTMGGGVGISVHGSHRVATERTLMAMPETAIGLFPDVGATYVLPRLPGALGMYLGLTGARLNGADCLWAGLATHVVPSGALAELERTLAATDLGGDAKLAVDGVLAGFAADPGLASLPALQARIEACYGRSSLAEVMAALAAEPSGWGAEQLSLLGRRSPTSLAVTFRQLQAGRRLSFDDAMRLEYRLVQRFMAGHDFAEGVRAVLIDKDHRPAWRPDRLDEIKDADIDAYFAPLSSGDLPLP